MVGSLFNNRKCAELESKVHSMATEMDEAIQLLKSIKEQKWDLIGEFKGRNTSSLLEAVLSLGQSVENLIKNEEEQLWKANALSEFSSLISDNQSSLEQLTQTVLSRIVKEMGSYQGAIYVSKEVKDEVVLELKAAYATTNAAKEIHSGNGLLGQCFLDGKRMVVTNIPADYIKISSGSGAALPRCVLVQPLNNHGRTIGVMEISSFKMFSSIQLEFIEQMSENLVSTVASVKESDQIKKLLHESELLTVELQIKDEMQKQRQIELENANREIEERKKEIKEILERESELIESKIKTHRELTEVVINKLKSKVSNLEKQLQAAKPMVVSYVSN